MEYDKILEKQNEGSEEKELKATITYKDQNKGWKQNYKLWFLWRIYLLYYYD